MVSIEEYHRALTELAKELARPLATQDGIRDALVKMLDAHTARLQQDAQARSEVTP